MIPPYQYFSPTQQCQQSERNCVCVCVCAWICNLHFSVRLKDVSSASSVLLWMRDVQIHSVLGWSTLLCPPGHFGKYSLVVWWMFQSVGRMPGPGHRSLWICIRCDFTAQFPIFPSLFRVLWRIRQSTLIQNTLETVLHCCR